MTEVKRHGGKRPGTGGRREGAGRPRSVLHLSVEAAGQLRTLVRQHPSPTMTEERFVENLIAEQWSELDDLYQANADQQEQ